MYCCWRTRRSTLLCNQLWGHSFKCSKRYRGSGVLCGEDYAKRPMRITSLRSQKEILDTYIYSCGSSIYIYRSLHAVWYIPRKEPWSLSHRNRRCCTYLIMHCRICDQFLKDDVHASIGCQQMYVGTFGVCFDLAEDRRIKTHFSGGHKVISCSSIATPNSNGSSVKFSSSDYMVYLLAYIPIKVHYNCIYRSIYTCMVSGCYGFPAMYFGDSVRTCMHSYVALTHPWCFHFIYRRI